MKFVASLFLAIMAIVMASAHATQELQIETVTKGDCSRVAKAGDSLRMHYEGTLENGSKFDSSYERGSPFEFTLGAGMVIAGWDKGLDGICKGEVRNLVIPPHMGYGDSGYPPVIPEKATLKFKVELVDFGSAGEEDL